MALGVCATLSVIVAVAIASQSAEECASSSLTGCDLATMRSPDDQPDLSVAGLFEDEEEGEAQALRLLQVRKSYLLHGGTSSAAGGPARHGVQSQSQGQLAAKRAASDTLAQPQQQQVQQRVPAEAESTDDASLFLEVNTTMHRHAPVGGEWHGRAHDGAPSRAVPLQSLCTPPAARPLGCLDPLGVAGWTWPQEGDRVPRWLYALAAFYSTLPAIFAYGLIVVFGGSGFVQLLSMVAFWLVVRPAATALEAVVLLRSGCPSGITPGLPATHATAAHFYWTWWMLELATRHHPLAPRCLALGLLSFLLLPIPAAQALLQDRSYEQVATGSLLGTMLGIGFFLVLHCRSIWDRLRRSGVATPDRRGGRLAYWLVPRDNLTTPWGGSLWPPALAERGRCKQLPANMADFLLLDNEDQLFSTALKPSAAAKDRGFPSISFTTSKFHVKPCAWPSDAGT